MRKFIIPAVIVGSMLFAASAEAGPLRKILGRAKAAVKRVAHVGHGHGSCARGRCSR